MFRSQPAAATRRMDKRPCSSDREFQRLALYAKMTFGCSAARLSETDPGDFGAV
jgi:hypothetical protein